MRCFGGRVVRICGRGRGHGGGREAARRRGRFLVDGILEIFRDFAGGLLEFAKALPQAAGQFGKPLGAEQNQSESEDNNDFGAVKHCEKGRVHKVSVSVKYLFVILGQSFPGGNFSVSRTGGTKRNGFES